MSTANSAIVSSRSDAGLVFGLGLTIALLLALTQLAGIGFIVVAVAFALLADLPHVLHTSVRLISNPVDWHRHGGMWLSSLLAIAAACSILYLSDNTIWVAIIWVYWQPFHVFKQNLGIIKIYAARSGNVDLIQPLLYVLLFGCLAPILFRIQETGFRFGSYEVLGRTLPFSGLAIPTPTIPPQVVLIAYGFFAVSVCWLGAALVRQPRAVRRAGALMLGTAVAFCATYNLAYLLVDDLYALILIATSMHALQYNLIVYAHQYRKATESEPGQGHSFFLLAYLNNRKLAVVCGSLVLSAMVISSLEFLWGGIVPAIFILHHFFIDGLIWKAPK